MTRTVILAPRRSDGGHRDRLWEFCRKRWQTDFPDWPIVEGHHDEGPFNRSAAINRASRDAGAWDVAVVIDCDVLAHSPAVRYGVEVASTLGCIVVSHDERVMLNKSGTEKVLGGFTGSWRSTNMVERVWQDSVSCAVIVPRSVWDAVGGFDELFVGWGFEDTAFRIAAETLTGKQLIKLSSELFHLWHPESSETRRSSPTYRANAIRVQRYRDARWRPDDLAVLLTEAAGIIDGRPLGTSRIPRILHRTCPAETTEQVETWWRAFQRLHPGWEMRTYRDPIDPSLFPLSSPVWDKCQNGAQRAGLIRLEALVHHGGVYVDTDVEPFRSMEPLTQVPAFAAWEDETTIPDAVLGAEPEHPAFNAMLDDAIAKVKAGADAWESGPGVTTKHLRDRRDVLLLPPGAFYPAHYLQKRKLEANVTEPWVFARHHWHHSWGTETQKASIARRQRDA